MYIVWKWCLLFSLVVADVHSSLISVPKNVAVLNGEDAILECATNSNDQVVWVAYPSGTGQRYIYRSGALSPDVASYISLVSGEEGQFNLKINATKSAAAKYSCSEPGTGTRANAELIVLETHSKCFIIISDDFVNATCVIKFSGNWAPVMEWMMWNGTDMVIESATETETITNHSVTSMLSQSRNQTWEQLGYTYKVQCTTAFSEAGRPTATASNIPDYLFVWNSSSIKLGIKDREEKQTTCPPNSDEETLISLISVTVVLALIIVILSAIWFRNRGTDGLEGLFKLFRIFKETRTDRQQDDDN